MSFTEKEAEKASFVPAIPGNRGFLKLYGKGHEVMIKVYNPWGTLDSTITVEGRKLEKAVIEVWQ